MEGGSWAKGRVRARYWHAGREALREYLRFDVKRTKRVLCALATLEEREYRGAFSRFPTRRLTKRRAFI